ncbi:hypothetical protein QZR30_27905, partial [Pseudomonas sp. rhizo25]|nr:hypothetical protein [Pseudomonas sp. rhizo25]
SHAPGGAAEGSEAVVVEAVNIDFASETVEADGFVAGGFYVHSPKKHAYPYRDDKRDEAEEVKYKRRHSSSCYKKGNPSDGRNEREQKKRHRPPNGDTPNSEGPTWQLKVDIVNMIGRI